jgi:aryl-alcohol dehydrogenase-like predicted oxidoreductase
MEYRELGRTGVKVSSLCLGTMTWGQQNSEADGHAQMDYALAQGINFFDTSEMYAVPPKPETQGSTERIIGSWFKARGTRHKVILATKIAGRSPMNWLRADKSTTEQTPKQIAEAIEASLKRLQTDYIDLYQLHWPDRPVAMFGANGLTYRHNEGASVPIADILGALNDHVKAGRIRWIGLSNETAWGTMSFLHEAARTRGPRLQSIQNAYSLINRTFEIGLAEIAMREHVGLLAYSPLAQGFLSGKYQGGALPAGARKTLFNRQQRYESAQASAAIDRYLEIAKQFGLDPAQMALKFVTERPFVTATILGATTMAQLKSDIDSAHVAWTNELEKAIDAAHHAQPNPAP